MVTLRLFQLVCAVIIIGISAWVVHTANTVRQKGDKIINDLFHGSPKEQIWQKFFDSLIKVPTRDWFALFAGIWVVSALLFLSLATKFRWRIASRTLLTILELLTMLLMTGAFWAVASLALELEPICILLDVAAPELLAFARICPVSKAYAVSGGLSWFLFLLTAVTVLVQNCCGRGREKKTLSFEPEAGGQAPGHPQPYAYGGYQQVPPVVMQQPPITYDPYGAPKSPGWKEQEQGFSVREVSGGAVELGSGEKALPMPPGSGRRGF